MDCRNITKQFERIYHSTRDWRKIVYYQIQIWLDDQRTNKSKVRKQRRKRDANHDTLHEQYTS